VSHPYASLEYARSLGHIGEPLAVPEWGGFVLTRPTQEGEYRDAIGPYPLTVLTPDADIGEGLERLKQHGLVSVVLVADPLSRPTGAIPGFDLARPFKTHQVHDPRFGRPDYGKHHRYEIRRAERRVDTREIELAEHLADWLSLYDALIRRHGLSGVHAFSPAYHEALAALPGLRTFGGFIDGLLVSAHVFVAHQGGATSHLAASSDVGYAAGAAYAVNALALEVLGADGPVNLGGGAGSGDDPKDGLARFKAGFANTTATAWLCGAILDPQTYQRLASDKRDSSFFPAYRGPIQREQTNAHQG
jgi:hypothetical protein